jgi:uncharacterized protein
MKISTLALVAALAGLAAGCGGATGGPAAGQGAPLGKQAAAEIALPQTGNGGTLPGITVVGTGSAKTVPDVSDWSFGVQASAGTASAALGEAAQATRRLIGALRRAGVAKADLRTDQVSLYPRTSDDGSTVIGYSASSSVTATLRRISKAGSVVDAAVGAGANQVSGPMLRVSDSQAQYRTAVDAALDDARARAQAIAAKAGVTLGAPVAIVEGSAGGGSPVPIYDRAAALAEVQIEPGTQEISASLTVTFAIS